MTEFSHINERGEAHMVDVSARDVAVREATASGRVVTTAASAIRRGEVPKGDVLGVARVAGIMAAKRTPDLIPLCHPIAIHGVDVSVTIGDDADEVLIWATVRTSDRTGVEMEALTAVAVAGLTVIDMVKSSDPGAELTGVRVDSKDGGRNGLWRREPR